MNVSGSIQFVDQPFLPPSRPLPPSLPPSPAPSLFLISLLIPASLPSLPLPPSLLWFLSLIFFYPSSLLFSSSFFFLLSPSSFLLLLLLTVSQRRKLAEERRLTQGLGLSIQCPFLGAISPEMVFLWLLGGGRRKPRVRGKRLGDCDAPFPCRFSLCVCFEAAPKASRGWVAPFLSSLLFIFLSHVVSFCLLFSPFTENLHLWTS